MPQGSICDILHQTEIVVHKIYLYFLAILTTGTGRKIEKEAHALRQQDLIRAALDGKATCVIKNANVVNVFTNEIIPADVALYEDVIIGIGEYSCENEIDAEGGYLAPGFIDAHVHIESSMVIPSSFMKVIMPHGTTTIIADPHEIANVAGVAGVRAMYKMTDDLPLRVLFMMPSCVPATPFEHSGAKLVAEDMEQFLRKSRILGLGEVMDYVSATGGAQEMLDKLRLFDGKPIDGHAPLLSGRALNAYRVAGPSTDHECSNYEEVKEKLRTGMRILIRVGSAAKGIEDILRSIARDGLPTENILFCTDDKHIETIRQEGHINCNARLAVSCGIPPVEAVKMASYNAARAYGLKNIGAIAPGYKADMVLFEDLKDFRVKRVFTRNGRLSLPARAGKNARHQDGAGAAHHGACSSQREERAWRVRACGWAVQARRGGAPPCDGQHRCGNRGGDEHQKRRHRFHCGA